MTDRPDNDLLLESKRTTLTKSAKNESCPRCMGLFQTVKRDENGQITSTTGPMNCKSWTCPVCGPKKAKQLRHRMFNGSLVNAAVNGYRDKFIVKMLTLTVPGKAFRATFTPAEAYDLMQTSFDKLIRSLKKTRGDFQYFRAVEPHKDGFPHFHVLLVGKAIAGIDVLNDIKTLWEGKYRMGFVQITSKPTKSPIHAVRYITKYMTKVHMTPRKHARLFSTSQGALAPIEKKEYLFSRFLKWAEMRGGNKLDTLKHEFNPVPEAIPKIVWDNIETDLRIELYGPTDDNEIIKEIVSELDKQITRRWS